MTIRRIADCISRAERVIVRHDVHRAFRLLSLLEWSAWLLTSIALFPVVIALLFMGGADMDGPASMGGGDGGGGGGPGPDPEPPESPPPRRRVAPRESRSRFFHDLHRLSIDVVAEDGSVLGSTTQRRAKRGAAEALVGSVVQLARDAKVPVEEETRIGETWSSYMRWDPSAPYMRRAMKSAPEAEARLRAAGVELSAGLDRSSLRLRIPPPPFSLLRDAVIEGSLVILMLALMYTALGLVNPFVLLAILLAQIPFLGFVYLLRPLHNTEDRPSIVQAALRLGDDYRLELDGAALTYRARRGLRWRKRTIPLRTIVGLNASSSLDYGRRARWIPARLCLITNDHTEWLDFRMDEDTTDDLADWIVHALVGLECRGAALSATAMRSVDSGARSR